MSQADPPVRDDVALAVAYKGAPGEGTGSPATAGESPAVGDAESFTILNIDSNVNVTIEAELLAASERAYFWFDTGVSPPEASELETVGSAFDQIYEQVVDGFGREESPGIDGDPRLHIVHGSPASLCDEADRCGIAGYFSSRDALPRAVSEHSNERDMFVMNADTFGTGFYLNVLAHEFRHMIEDNYDKSDADWEIEGSAVLAEELAGFRESPISRGNAFLEDPDRQLNRWTDANTLPHYGQGYVLNRYIYDRLGPDLYRAFTQHPADGLAAVTAVAEANGLALTGESLWLDWLAALAIHNHPSAPERYRLGDGQLDTATMTEIDDSETLETTVHQYAADYYRLHGNGTVNLEFEGSKRVPLLDIGAHSGEHYWYAQRVNYSHMQLTRAVDLSSVESATLNYSVYHDIEYSYDFAYVSVSSDGGETWQGLAAEQMQGRDPEDNSNESALTDRFYTGQSEGWIEESIDLSAFAGQEILLRFSYVTDPILTFGGLALDNISIPEIGFYDDAETPDAGWRAEGFTRASATLPQSWHLQLITFPDDVPTVSALPTDAAQTLTHSVNLEESGGEAILIVAATAPMTLEEGSYRLEIGD